MTGIAVFGPSPQPAGAVPGYLVPEEAARAQRPETRTGAPATRLELSPEAQRIVRDLAARDREVRQHEEAHARVGGKYAGQPRYAFTEGPDGRRYATSGEVSIDVSPVRGDPEATIEKMEVVKKAALAPARPSQQDRNVAAQADAQRIAAEAEARRQEAGVDPDAASPSLARRLEAERREQAYAGARTAETRGSIASLAA